jgi:hypothetical protein
MRTPRIIASKVCQKTIYDNGLYIETAFVTCGQPARFVIMSKSLSYGPSTRNGETFRAHIKYRGKSGRLGRSGLGRLR